MVAHGKGEAHSSSHVGAHEVIAGQAFGGDHGLDVGGDSLLVVPALWPGGLAEAAQIGGDYPVGAGEQRDDLPPSNPRLGESVQQYHGLAVASHHIVNLGSVVACALMPRKRNL